MNKSELANELTKQTQEVDLSRKDPKEESLGATDLVAELAGSMVQYKYQRGENVRRAWFSTFWDAFRKAMNDLTYIQADPIEIVVGGEVLSGEVIRDIWQTGYFTEYWAEKVSWMRTLPWYKRAEEMNILGEEPNIS